VISLIRGKKGTKVTLGVVNSVEDLYSSKNDITITRDTIEVPSVYTETLTDKAEDLDEELEYFYISVNQFSDDTEAEFLEAVNQILVDQPDGIILDLRFNGGGYLTTSVDMLGDLLENGKKVVNIQESSAKLENEIYSSGQARITETPLVVLVNEASASASEIVAGAIQDNKRGVVIGTQTYGKGTVQELIPFSDNSTLRLTVSKWLTPLGTDIDKEGIKPDILIDFTDADIEAGIDVQLEKAKEYLRGLK
jgi:carboxyl-terminal processing protease